MVPARLGDQGLNLPVLSEGGSDESQDLLTHAISQPGQSGAARDDGRKPSFVMHGASHHAPAAVRPKGDHWNPAITLLQNLEFQRSGRATSSSRVCDLRH
eukprot:1923122-Rhodomonas_salina.1